ncbi:MAG: aspartyl protease family protein [Asticcacaulis sp.]
MAATSVRAQGDGGFTVRNGDSGLFLPATLKDRAVDGIFDCGCSRTVIDSGTAKAFGIVAVDQVDARFVYAKGKMGVAGPTRMTIAGQAFTISPYISALRAAGLDCDMLVGMDVWKAVTFDLDGPGLRGRLLPVDAAPAPGMASVSIDNNGSDIIWAPLLIEGKSTTAQLDTGSGTALTLSRDAATALGLIDGRPLSQWISGDLTGIYNIDMTSVKEMNFGGVVFRDMPVEISDHHATSEISIGLPILLRCRTRWDMAHNRLWLAADTTQAALSFERERAGLAYLPDKDRLNVLFVAPGSPAAKAGWKTGDVIIAIDGVTIADLDPETLLDWKHDPSRTSVRLTVAGGEVRTLALAAYY